MIFKLDIKIAESNYKAELNMEKNSRSHFAWLRITVITLLVIGVFFRWVNLDRKVFWGDETNTLKRIVGYTWAETDPQLYNGRELGIEDLQKIQRLNSEKSVFDTVKGLAAEEPQHPPLYYVLSRFWVQWFGNSVAVIRSVAALLSLLVFPSLWWLCRELFESSLPGWIAIALIAVSPFHVLYAQEAREYSFWTATILLSSAALLRAMRLKTNFNWFIYAATVVLGLYTYLFSFFVVVGHGIYIIVIERFKLNKIVKDYLLATVGGIIVFLPWLVVVVNNISQINQTTSWSQQTGWVIGQLGEKLSLPFKWARNITLVFIDADPERRIVYFGFDNLILYLIQLFFIVFIVILVIYSIYFICRHAPKQTWLFILTLLGVTALALMLPDLIFGGVRSLVSRYLIPFYLGIQLAISYTIASKISYVSTNNLQRKLWQIVMVTLLSLGVISCVVISQAQGWWTKSLHEGPIAQIINKTAQPVLVCVGESSFGAVTFSYLLETKAKLQLVIEPKLPNISSRFSDVFVYTISDSISEKIFANLEKDKRYKLKPIYKEVKSFLGQKESQVLLWKLEKL